MNSAIPESTMQAARQMLDAWWFDMFPAKEHAPAWHDMATRLLAEKLAAHQNLAGQTCSACPNCQAPNDLKASVRNEIATLAEIGELTIDQASRILDRCGLRALNRIWTVRMQIPITIKVTGADEEDAMSAAYEVIEAAWAGNDAVTVHWDRPMEDKAIAGQIDISNP